jgi:hypothetical protein
MLDAKRDHPSPEFQGFNTRDAADAFMTGMRDGRNDPPTDLEGATIYNHNAEGFATTPRTDRISSDATRNANPQTPQPQRQSSQAAHQTPTPFDNFIKIGESLPRSTPKPQPSFSTPHADPAPSASSTPKAKGKKVSNTHIVYNLRDMEGKIAMTHKMQVDKSVIKRLAGNVQNINQYYDIFTNYLGTFYTPDVAQDISTIINGATREGFDYPAVLAQLLRKGLPVQEGVLAISLYEYYQHCSQLYVDHDYNYNGEEEEENAEEN